MGWGDIAKAAFSGNPVAAVGTALGAGGLDYLSGKSLQQDSQSFSAREAQRSRDFQQFVMQNQIQWRYKDLEKAGINPILASTMNGMSIPGNTAGSAGMSHAAPGATALQAARTMAELNVMKAQANKLDAEAKSTTQNIDIKKVAESVATLLTGLIGELEGAAGIDPKKPLSSAKPISQKVVESVLPIPSRVRESVTSSAKEGMKQVEEKIKTRTDSVKKVVNDLLGRLEVLLRKN